VSIPLRVSTRISYGYLLVITSFPQIQYYITKVRGVVHGLELNSAHTANNGFFNFVLAYFDGLIVVIITFHTYS
jgi:hypothetical protein